MISFEKCALCGNETKLVKSHIIPKFTVKWLKKTSATGYLRMAKNPNFREQDLPKIKLLCNNCEIRLSKRENLFAEKIFIPFLEKAQNSFKYEKWLIYFAVSLAWRTVIKDISNFKRESNLSAFVDTALTQWSSFLIGTHDAPGSYEHHLFLLDFVADTTKMDVPDMFHWYLLRGVDSTIVYSSKEVFVYTKLPGFIFWSAIQPPKAVGWKNTMISESGIIEPPQYISQQGFGDFLLERAAVGLKLKKNLSEKQREQIIKSVLKNPEKTINSEGFKVVLIDKYLRNRKKNNY